MSALQKVFGFRLITYHLSLKTVRSQALLIIISLLFIANLFIFTSPVHAATDDCVISIKGWCPLGEKNYDDEVSVQRLTRNILVASHVAIIGTNPMGGNVYQENFVKDEQGRTSYVPGLSPGNPNNGALAMTTNTIASLYNPPTSSMEYLANLGENIGISPKTAYAQAPTGSGSNVISPVLKIWQAMRNITYIAFILVFIAAGVMIMFRQRLNPQTVIGIQQALPGLVIGLILVTFSYFIAALIIDLSFIGTRLVAQLFISTSEPNYYGCTVLTSDGKPCGSGDNEKELLNTANNPDAFEMYGKAGRRFNNIPDIFGQLWGTLGPKEPPRLVTRTEWWQQLWDATPLGRGMVIANNIGALIGLFTNNVAVVGQAAVAGIGATLGALLIPLILVIALMIQFIRLIIALLMSYLQILIMVIFGPFLVMISAIPGRGATLTFWLKSLLANALVFPAVFAGFLFAGMLLEWNASALQGAAMPLFGGLSPDILKSVLAFGVLLGLPSIPDMVRDAFGVKAPQGFAQAAVGGFMAGVSTGRGTVTGGYGQAMEKTGIRAQQQAYEKYRIESQANEFAPKAKGGGGKVPNIFIRGFRRS